LKKVPPAEENQEQKEIRLQGACAVVASEVNRTPAFVYDFVGIEDCYSYAKTNGLDLVWVVRESFKRTSFVTSGVQQLSEEFKTEIETVWRTAKWYDVYVDAEHKSVNLYDQMKAVFMAEQAQPSAANLKPKMGLLKVSEAIGMERFTDMKGPPDSKDRREKDMEEKRKLKKEKLLKKKREGVK